MSYIDWRSTLPQRGSAWRFFPLAVIISMTVVVVVNAGMVYEALHSFPGATEGDDGFSLSNHYDTVLDQAQREVTLGWNVAAQTDDSGHAVVVLTDRRGDALRGAAVAASAERPLGAPEARSFRFQEVGAGRYVADGVLPLRGQWELTLTASAGGHTLAATRRVVVR